MSTTEILSNYGVVKTCKVVKDQVVTIVITNGFSENATKTFDFLAKCQELFPEYPKVETCITEKDLAILVLVK
jgi:hypothetical protein